MRSGLSNAKDSEAIKMNNLSIMEISAIRPFFVESMDSFFVLHEAVDEAFQGAPGWSHIIDLFYCFCAQIHT